ncbi:MAG: 16S rRNA (guanine(966)-N(2))-methyltransferase RsmD [Eubacteriales bacterium]|nr:16S rRNA (guanine(966)-N(2))-methyltransferase RsmD [Eubacteriales bacterium]
MRIIAGAAKGRQLLTPAGSNTRPTLDRVRESLFGILQFRLDGIRVLDLFAGSGSLGLEALSRGASYAVFNDHDRNCCNILRKNIHTLGFQDRAEVLQREASAAIIHVSTLAPFDIAFLDPPYAAGAQKEAEALFVSGCIADNGMVIIEHDWNKPPIDVPNVMYCADRRKYRETGISFFKAFPREGDHQ